MKIKTQFITTMILFGATLVAISASAFITDIRVQKEMRQKELASSISQGASELSYLANDYIIYREDQQLVRWQTRFSSFSGDVASLNSNDPEQRALIRNIQTNTQRLKEVFASIASSVSSVNGTKPVDAATLQISWSRISVQSQTLLSDSNHLSQLLGNRVDQLQGLNFIVIFTLVLVFAAYFLANYWLVYRHTLKSIATLQAGAEVIGSGNLDFQIKEKSNDEIGDLSRAFNNMASNLKTITASKTDLEKEIVERKQAEQEAREKTREWQNTFNAVSDYISIHDKNFCVIQANNALAARLGINVNEITGKNCYKIFHGTNTPWQDCPHRSAIEQKQPVTVEFYEPNLKEYLEVSCSPIVAENGEIMGTVHLARNVTERKKVEEALRDTRDYLDNLFNYANAPIIVWNQQFEITRFNHAFERLTGRPAEEVIGKKLDILFPADSRESSLDFIRKALSGERWEAVEIPILNIDGTVQTVLWNSANIYATDGKTPIATIAQGQDITARKQAEEELKHTNNELEVSNKELESFSYSVSHDLRAPLRSMEGFSVALIEDYGDILDERGKQYLKYVQESSNLMAQLIEDLLKLSRVTRSEISHERVDLSETAENIIAALKVIEPQRKVKTTIAPNLVTYGDRNLLRLVLENLLGNAWKFSSKNESALVEMDTVDYNGKKAFVVRDNGVGFDMTYYNKLFLPFQRLHKASDFPGTGIGLATVQRIIRRHGGEVWAESKEGQGSTFYFTLG